MTNPKDTGPQESTAQSTAADRAALLVEQASLKIAKQDISGACALLDQACLLQPRSVELLTSTAMAWLQAADPRRAEEYLSKAHRFAPNNPDVLHNLALVRSTLGKFEEASECLHKLILLAPTDASAYNDLAVLEEETGNYTGALDAYQRGAKLNSAGKKLFTNFMDFCLRHKELVDIRKVRSQYLDRWGEDHIIKDWESQHGLATRKSSDAPIVIQHLSPTARIAIIASYRTFVDPIINDLKRSYDVRVFEKGSEAELRALLEWADLAWFEWCDQNLITATKFPKKCKIVCRLHSYEVFTDMPRQVDWTKVDHLVLVSEAVGELLSYNVQIPTPITIIHNGLDTEKFTIPSNKPTGKKICSIGYINYKKNPSLLLYCFKAIHDYDPGTPST